MNVADSGKRASSGAAKPPPNPHHRMSPVIYRSYAVALSKASLACGSMVLTVYLYFVFRSASEKTKYKKKEKHRCE